MGLSLMEFDRVWTNPMDFPTHESQESIIRADIQYLFDSIKTQYNRLISTELKAENIPFDPTSLIAYDNIQEAIEYVMSQISSSGEHSIPDGSITTRKLDNGAVTTDKLDDLAVSTDKLKDGAVTPAKLAVNSFTGAIFEDGSIPAAKLVPGSLLTENIADGQITFEKLKSSSVYGNRIKDKGVIAGKLDDGAVAEENLQDNAVTTNKIKNLAVTSGKIKDDAVTLAKLASNSVNAAKIVDGSITKTELATALKNEIEGKQDKYTTATTTLETGVTTWTKSVTGVTTTCDVDVTHAEDDDSWEQWCNCGIRCSAQGSGTLTFKARSAPTHSVDVNIRIWK